MAFQCGFFNSENGDRRYNAEQMSNPYKRIISDGVFAEPSGEQSTDMQVIAKGGMTVAVKEGQGMFAGKWAILDAEQPFTVPMAHVTYTRIDSIIVRIDTSEDVRAGTLVYRSGEPTENPAAPALVNTTTVHEFRLANISVVANATEILQSGITDTRNTTECGFIHNLLWNPDITATYTQWQAQFDEWFQTVRETLATATIITSFSSQYTATTDGEKVIPIGTDRYNRALDILQVYINGLYLTEGVDYTITSDTQITLTLGIDAGTPVSFVIYKSVDGSEAETVVRQVEELYSLLAVSDNGGVEISVPATGDVLASFDDAGVGLHTMYSAYGATNSPKLGAYRYLGHLTAAGYGWLIAFMANGSVFSNYLDNGTWQGWRALYDDVPTSLYSSANGVFPNANVAVTPSKPLSECRNGWTLEFTGYDDSTSTARDLYVQTVQIPKQSYKGANWNGETMCFPLAYQYVNESDTTLMCLKNFTIYNDRIVSGSLNATGKQRNVVLRAIYEY